MKFFICPKLVLLVLLSVFTINISAESPVDIKTLEETCDQEIAKEPPDKKVFLKACTEVASYREGQKNYNGASWYFLLGGKFKHNVSTIKPLVTANYAHSNIAFSHVLMASDEDEIRSTFNKYLQQSPIDIADETLRGDYNVLLKLHPDEKENLDRALVIWKALNEPLKPFLELSKRYQEAVAAKDLSKSIEILKETQELEKELLAETNPSRLETQLALGISYNQNQEYKESLKIFSEIEVQYQSLANERVNYAKLLHWIAADHQQLNQLDQAKDYYNKSVIVKEEAFGKEHLELASIYRDFAAFSELIKDQANTVIYYEKLLNVYQQAGYADDISITPLFDKLATLYSSISNYPKAIESQNKSLILRKKVLGEDHLDTATSYNNLGIHYAEIGDNKKALEYYQKTLNIRQKILKPEDEMIAQSYNNIGSAYSDLNDVIQAIENYKKALVINEKALGFDHPETSTNINNLALAYKKSGNYTDSLVFYKKAIKAKEKSLGVDSIETSQSYNGVGTLYVAMGDYPNAIEYLNKALAIRERVLGRTNDLTADTYNNIGHSQQALGRYGDARESYTKALRVYDKIFGEEHPNTATSFANLGSLFEQLADYPKALVYYNKALTIRQKILGEEHLVTATSYNNLGAFYTVLGDYPQALENYKKCLAIREKVLGPKHPLTAQINNNLGSVYAALANYTKAIEYYEIALDVNEKELGAESIATATNYNNIGLAYQSLGKTAKAVKYISKSLGITIKVLGENRPQVATSYNNMGLLSTDQRDYPKALEYYQKALKIREKLFGLDHPSTASSYGALAVLYGFMGENKKSLNYYKKTLEIRKTVFGSEHMDVSDTYSNMSVLYWAMDDAPNYYKSIKRAFDIFLKNRDQVFSVLDSQQKNKYLKNNSQKISFLLDATDKSMQAFFKGSKNKKEFIKKTKRLLGNTVNDWLNYKGSVFDSENTIAMLYEKTNDKQVKSKIDQLIASKRALAKLYQSIPKRKERKAWSNNIAKLKKRLEILNNAIAEKASDFKSEQGLSAIKASDIATHLDEKTLYIDYFKSEHHYYLFTLDNRENTNFVKFNAESTVEIDKLVQSFRSDIATILEPKAMSNEQKPELTKSSKEKLAKLYKMLLSDPIGEQIKDKENLILSADGALRLLPFEALFNEEKKRYLIENKTVRYTPSGKELVRLFQVVKSEEESGIHKKAVIFANPDFDKVLEETNNTNKKSAKPLLTSTSRAGVIKSLFKMRFNNLPGTKAEAEAIKETLKEDGVIEFLKESATESNLIKVDNPRILHIATHGFFLNDKTIPNPLLKSGIALAGANASVIQGKSGGIVTALKLSGLSLKDTELVVLSACETGVVDTNSTESVSGLSKAFIQAGAKNIVMSLWSVADQETMELMKGFYQEIKKDKDYSEALRNSKLKMIKEDLHPFYWAAFIINGASG